LAKLIEVDHSLLVVREAEMASVMMEMLIPHCPGGQNIFPDSLDHIDHYLSASSWKVRVQTVNSLVLVLGDATSIELVPATSCLGLYSCS